MPFASLLTGNPPGRVSLDVRNYGDRYDYELGAGPGHHPLLEAAALDGAGPWARFRHVTMPLLAPTAAFVATTSLVTSFQAFDVVRIMTQGGPVRATELFVYAIYEQIFLNLSVGRASALTVVFFLLLLAVAGLQLRVWRAQSAGATRVSR